MTREEAIEQLRNLSKANFFSSTIMALDMAIEALSVDAVEVVRCKDCKWSDWYKTLNGEHRCYCMEHGSSGHTDDDYCSYGEQEDGEA